MIRFLRGLGSGASLTSGGSTFLASVSPGALIAALSHPFGGGETYAAVGTVPGQLALSGGNVVAGASAAVAGSGYAVKVRATSSDGKREVAETLTFTAQAGVVTAPTNTALPAISGAAQVGQALACSQGSWTGSPTGYAFQWRWSDTAAIISGATSANYTPAAGDAGHTLDCVVTATNSGGSTSATAAATAAVLAAATAPAAPTFGLALGNGQITLSWNDNGNGGSAITGHKLYRGTAAGGEALIGTISTASPYIDSPLTNGTKYYYRLSAVNNIGESPLAAEQSATPAAAPAQVTGLAATAAAGQVGLTWTAPAANGSAITDYVVEYRTGAAAFTVFNDGVSTATSATVTGLTNGTSYDFRVSAVNGVGTGPTSAVASAAPASGYVAPALATALVGGDSRAAGMGGMAASSPNYATGSGVSDVNQLGLVQIYSGNRWLLDEFYQFAVGSTSSRHTLTCAIDESGNNRTGGNNVGTGGGNPAGSFSGRSADYYWNTGSNGQYTILTAPGNHVDLLTQVNDAGNSAFSTPYPASVSIANVAEMLDRLGAAGKMVRLYNGFPIGGAYVQNEPLTVSSGTCTALHTTGFQEAASFNGAPPRGIFGTATRLLTKGASAVSLTQDQYWVTSGGVYTFGGTPPDKIVHDYNWDAGASTTDPVKAYRAWCNSSDAVFTYGGNTYTWPATWQYAPSKAGQPMSGALYNRPFVRVVDTFTPSIDPNRSGAIYSRPGTMYATDTLGLHGSELLRYITAKAAKTVIDQDYAASPSLTKAPTRNNWQIGKGNGTSLTVNGTAPPSMRLDVPTLIGMNSVVIGRVDNISGTATARPIVACNNSATIASGTFNTSTGAWSITFASPASTSFPVNGQLTMEQDIGNGTFDASGNWLENGTIGRQVVFNAMADMFQAVGSNLPNSGTGSIGSSPANFTASQVPYAWTMDFGALDAAVTAGTATVSVVTETSLGYTRFVGIEVDGMHSAAFTYTLTPGIIGATARITAGDKVPQSGRYTYARHRTKNYFYGIGQSSFFSLNAGTSFTRIQNGASTTGFTNESANGGFGAIDTVVLNENAGPLIEDRMSPRVDTTGFGTISGVGTFRQTITGSANVPFSAFVKIELPSIRRRNDV